MSGLLQTQPKGILPATLYRVGEAVRHLPLPLATSVLAISCALLPGIAGAESPGTAVEGDSFEVVVIRGGGVSLVTGTRSGVIREETLREDPRPARREAPPRPRAPLPTGADQITIVVYDEPSYSFLLYDPSFARQRLHRRGHNPRRRVFLSDRSRARFHHGRARHQGRVRGRSSKWR